MFIWYMYIYVIYIKKSSLCRRVSEAAKSQLGISISGSTLFDASASLPFSRCPMRLTRNWVTERSSHYLIHLVKLTNIQPRNNIIIKKHKKEKPKIYLY